MIHLEHLNLVVKNIPNSLKFYQAAFPHWSIRGGDKSKWSGKPRNWVHFGDDYQYLSLNDNGENENRDLTGHQVGLAHFAFVTHDLKNVMARLALAGFTSEKGDIENKSRQNLYYLDPDGQIIDVKWDLAEGNTSNSLNLSHTYQTAGQYQVSLTVTDNEGAQAGTAISVNVTDLDALPIADFSYNKSGLQVSFINPSTDDVDITNAIWAFGDGQMALTKNSQNIYSQSGSYDVTLTVSDSAGQ